MAVRENMQNLTQKTQFNHGWTRMGTDGKPAALTSAFIRLASHSLFLLRGFFKFKSRI